MFAFFADATNLEAMTPAWLHFQMISPAPIAMEAGTLIDYRIRVHGLALNWRTRINVWEPPHRFVDEQVRGPYRLWIHEHVFEPLNDGTLMRDHVRYAVPLDFIAHRLIVRRDLERIFTFRAEALRKVFDVSKES